MREVKKILGTRVMIKESDSTVKTGGGLVIKDDGQSLSEAIVVMLSDEVNQVEVGDKVHYTSARESGKCRHKGDTHYIIPIANIVAIVEDE